MDWAAGHARPCWRWLLARTPTRAPSVAWFKTRKGRGYLKYDNDVARRAAHAELRAVLGDQAPVRREVRRAASPTSAAARRPTRQALQAEFAANLQAVIDVLHRDQALVDYLADRLVALGDSVPEEMPGLPSWATRAQSLQGRAAVRLPQLPGRPVRRARRHRRPTGQRLAKWGAWVNAFGAEEYGRPLFLACSADLAESTNITGFAKGYGDFPGYGWYERDEQPPRACCCRRRSPSSPTPACWPAWPP